jgi:NADH-quinone oxidoreductase subunit N
MFDFPVPTIDFASIAPILIVVVTGMVALILEMIRPRHANSAMGIACLIGLFTAGYFTAQQFGQPDSETLAGMFVRDRFGLVMQLILVLAASLAVLFSDGYLRAKRIAFGEFYPLLIWSTAGAMMMATTKNLLMLFVGLEVLSISLYVLAGMSRTENKSEESALKYFLLGAFASGFLLYGIAMVYGATGSLHVSAISDAWTNGIGYQHTLLIFGLGLMLVGLGFKAAFVPFHQWTPDVYQGAPTNVTAFMAAGSKIAAIAALVRVLDGMLALSDYWMPALFWVAILTMSVGNLAACVQKDVKRILGYSSIAHAGYLLVAVLSHLSNPAEIGFGAISYYLVSYTLMTVGAFAIVTLGTKDGREATGLQDLNGLWQRSPYAAGLLVIFMISLIGIPPTAGFFGKLYIFNDALRAGLTPLAIVLAVNSIISIWYYAGIAKAALVAETEGEAPSRPLGAGLATAGTVCAAGLFAAVIFLTPLMDWLVGSGATSNPPVTASVQELARK